MKFKKLNTTWNNVFNRIQMAGSKYNIQIYSKEFFKLDG